MANTVAPAVGLGFPQLLTLLFIGLKLTGFITWSWWWVLAPMWISMSIGLALLLIVIIGVVLLTIFGKD